MNRPQSNNVEERKTLWVGDVQTWMDESYLRSLFSKTGHIQSVKIMRDKVTNQPVGYGFVEFTSHEVAAKVLQLFTGSINPATNKPFKLNWGVYGGSSNAPTLPLSSKNVPVYRGSHHPDGPFSSTSRLGAKLSGTIENKVSVYVGDMDITINQDQLLNHFLAKCPTALTSKIIVDPKTQLSKGYGFVTFATKEEADRAIKLMDGSKLRGKPIKCRPSYIKANSKGGPQEMEKPPAAKPPAQKYQSYGGGGGGGNSLPTLGMGMGNNRGRNPGYGRGGGGGNHAPRGFGLGVQAQPTQSQQQQQYQQQLILQYQQIMQQQRYFASQPALLSNPVYYQQYMANQAYLANQSILAGYGAAMAQAAPQFGMQAHQMGMPMQMQMHQGQVQQQNVDSNKEPESRYNDNPFLTPFPLDDSQYEEEGKMEIEETPDEIDNCPQLGIYKFMQDYNAVR